MDKEPRSNLWIAWMETLDGLGYITAGFSFLVLGMVVFAHAWFTFLTTWVAGVLPAALTLIHDLLLVVILLELFRTIRPTSSRWSLSCTSASLHPPGAF